MSDPGAYRTAHERAAPMAAGPTGPLKGIRIVDFTRALAGPFCTMLLADLGADVIKVEPPEGDFSRFSEPYPEGDTERAFGGYFASINRNKRGVMVDLKDPNELGTADQLIYRPRMHRFPDPRTGRTAHIHMGWDEAPPTFAGKRSSVHQVRDSEVSAMAELRDASRKAKRRRKA